MAKKYADLHLHTNASDGELPPGEMVKMAKEAGLAAVGIVDHDTVDGIEPARRAGKRYGVEIISGVEFSCQGRKSKFHILGYCIDWREPGLLDRLRNFQEDRRHQIRGMVGKLQKLGIDLSYEEVLKLSGGGSIGRPHIARAMLRRGYIRTPQEAFDRYLRAKMPAYVGRYELEPREAINLIRAVGGAPVLAHPIYGGVEELPWLVRQGLRGIEAYHSDHDSRATRLYLQLARKHGLLVIGGSDSHGADPPVGSIRVPWELVEELKREADEIRGA
ncbi:MAG: PHP domain-containing protein [Candidatus Hadarchaeota archaeon]|nr:PHP domain-containing protein [Candidatus Hadarchaeota archaeon]